MEAEYTGTIVEAEYVGTKLDGMGRTAPGPPPSGCYRLFWITLAAITAAACFWSWLKIPAL